MVYRQRGFRRAINATASLAILLLVVLEQVFSSDVEDVAVRSNLAAEPELPARRDEEIFVTSHASPLHWLLEQHLFLVIEKVPTRPNLLAVAFQFFLFLDE